MKRFLASALILSSFSVFGLVGCEGDTTKSVEEKKVSGPGGTQEVKQTTEVKDTTGATPSGTNAPVEPAKTP